MNYSLDGSSILQDDPIMISKKGSIHRRALGGASSQMLQNQGIHGSYNNLYDQQQYNNIKRNYIYNYNSSQSMDTLPKNEQYMESIDMYKMKNNKQKILHYQSEMKNTIENHRRQRMKENINQITEVYSGQKKNKYHQNKSPLMVNGINNGLSYNSRLAAPVLKSSVQLPELNANTPYANSKQSSNIKLK